MKVVKTERRGPPRPRNSLTRLSYGQHNVPFNGAANEKKEALVPFSSARHVDEQKEKKERDKFNTLESMPPSPTRDFLPYWMVTACSGLYVLMSRAPSSDGGQV